MASIWEGNFVLGNTSATTLSAGPGIKIDDSSVPGVIKVSTDETVLFENGTNATKSASLAENISNFEWLKVRMDDDHNGGRWITVDTTKPWCKWLSNYGYDEWNTGSTNFGFRELGFSANGTAIISLNGVQKQAGWNATTWDNTHQTGRYAGIIKVIGINRISGGN